MKKIITSFLFAIAVSSSFLLAQNNNKLEEENQRLKATNQVTGCRFQVVGSRKAELPSEDQIAQEAETTTNYNNNQDTGYRLQALSREQATGNREQVRNSSEKALQLGEICQRAELTTNCANSAGSLNCHLMMNPAMAEEGITSLKRKLECLEGNATIHIPSTSPTVDSLTESTVIHAPVVQETLFTRTEEGKNTFEINEKSQNNGDNALCTHMGTTTGTSTETQKTTIPVEQSVDFLDDNSIVQVPATETMASLAPIGKNLGDRILALPDDLINYIVEFLRSPEAKQTAYKAEHQQLLIELQEKYPEATNKIVDWKRAMETWSECSFPKEKEARYQEVVTLATSMSSEFYRLVALSQAMKIIEDAIAYRKFLSLAFVKYDKNAQTEEEKLAAARAKTYLLTQLDSVNKNIEKLEKAADAVMRLSEQRNRCLASADAATITTKAEGFKTAARAAQEAITSYCQFSQKMKEGEPATAFLLRMEGLYLEGEALFGESKRLHTRPQSPVSFTFKQSVLCYLQEIQSFGNWNIPKQNEEENDFSEEQVDVSNLVEAAYSIGCAAKELKQAGEAKSEGSIELATVLKQLAHYRFQTAQVLAYGDPLNAREFSRAANDTSSATVPLKKAANSRKQGKIEIAKVFEQSSQYYLQAAQASANGDLTNAKNFRKIAFYVSKAAFVRETTAQYSLQAAQAIANGDPTNAENFAKASFYTNQIVLAFDNMVQAKNEGKDDIAKVYEASIRYHEKAAISIANGNSTNAEFFLKITTYIHNALDLLKATFYNQDSNEGYNNNRDSTNAEKNLKIVTCIHNAIDLLNKSGLRSIEDHRAGIYHLEDLETALYYLRHAEIYAQEGIERGDAFTREIYDQELRIRNGAN